MSRAISVRNLEKTYRIYHGPRGMLKGLLFGSASYHLLHALRAISFEIEEGEVFGVVGDNGAGKSTLLKLLTGTAVPTAGELEIQGRVAALLELGAGFHPEFSGRENIHFHGSVIGLSRSEVEDRLQSIIDFSELGPFIDEPVKTYSSGMYVRLGFSVATGFDFTTLVIDEALAVGDQRFQKKCTDRILDCRSKGRTILFCSHNLHQVRSLCDRALWLDKGEARAIGPAEDTVEAYASFIRDPGQPASGAGGMTVGGRESQICWVERARLFDGLGRPQNRFRLGETLTLELEGHFAPSFNGKPAIAFSLVRNDGVVLYTASTGSEGIDLRPLGGGRFRTKVHLLELPLLAGSYHFNVCTTDQNSLQAYDIVERMAPFTVTHSGADQGLVRLAHRWE